MQSICQANNPEDLRLALVEELDRRLETNRAEQEARRSRNDKTMIGAKIRELETFRDFLATLLIAPKPADKPTKA